MSRMTKTAAPTRPDLLDALQRAAQYKMTPAEMEEQRRSYVRAELGFGSDADEAAYRNAWAAGDREEMARLDAKAKARMDAFDAVSEGRSGG